MMPVTKTKTLQQDKLSILDILYSALGAMLGVQSKARLERDFTSGEVVKFIAVGVVFTVTFLTLLIFIVSLIV